MYPLIGHSCTESDLQFLQKPIDNEVLHILGLNEHFPRAVLHAPLLYGGLGFAPLHAQHGADKLILFLHHIRECGKTQEALMTTMSITQIECGASTPFINLQPEKWSHLVTDTWVTHLWRECKSQDIDIVSIPSHFGCQSQSERTMCVLWMSLRICMRGNLCIRSICAGLNYKSFICLT